MISNDNKIKSCSEKKSVFNKTDLIKYLYIFCLALIFIFAIYIRISRNLDIRPLWHDEAPIALTVMKNNILTMFYNIEEAQKAPFLFWIGIKLSGILFGYRELSLRILPLTSSILSLFIFYIFSKKFLNNKISIITANLLFALNYQLIYFSQELKQYSSDVLLFMCALLFFSSFACKNSDKKNTIYICLFGIFLILSSFPACFVITAFVFYKLFNLQKDEIKNFIISILVVFIFALLYYFCFLNNLYSSEITNQFNYWQDGFLSLNNNILYILKNIYLYNFFPCRNYILGLLLFFIGLIIIAKEKKPINNLLIISIIIVFLASAMHLYPLYNRVQVYLIPVFIICILKITDIQKLRLQYKILIFTILIINFLSILNCIYLQEINKKNIFETWNGRETLKFIKDNFKENDTLLVNIKSKGQYEYYSKYYNFKPKKVLFYDLGEKTQQECEEYFNNLETNKSYWFLIAKPAKDSNEKEYLINWKSKAKNVKTKYEYIRRKSYVLKIEII